MHIIFCLLTLLPMVSHASDTDAKLASFKALPPLIVDTQNLLARMPVCQPNWAETAVQAGVLVEKLDENTTLYAVPCSKWNVNLGLSVYVTVKESTHPDGYVTLPMRFVSLSATTVVGENQVYNIRWNSEYKVLSSEYHNDARGICGTRAAYAWNSAQQSFDILTLQKRDDCNDPNAQWQRLGVVVQSSPEANAPESKDEIKKRSVRSY